VIILAVSVPARASALVASSTTPSVVVVAAATLAPEIWSFASVNVPAETSSVLPEPTVIFAPLTVPPVTAILENVCCPVQVLA